MNIISVLKKWVKSFLEDLELITRRLIIYKVKLVEADRFSTKSSFYYYGTWDKSLEIGDYVEVPGQDRTYAVELVARRSYCSLFLSDDLPKRKFILKLIKKHNAPVSSEKSLFGPFPTEANPNEDTQVEGLFHCLDKLPCEVQDALTEEQIAHFEEINQIKLPIQYREMLLTEGNGLRIHYKTPEDSVFRGEVHHRIISGIKWDEKFPNDRLSRPFIFGQKIKGDIDELPFPQFNDCLRHTVSDCEGVCRICDHRKECIYSLTEPARFGLPYRNTPFYNGTLELVDAGCTYSYHLILNGPHRGEVWFSDENLVFFPWSKSFKEFLHWICTAESI